MASLALAFDILARDRASRTFKDVGDAADRAGKKGEGFGAKMRGGLMAAGGTVAKFGGIAIAGLGAAGIAGLKMGLDVAAGNEQAKISFTTMLGSAQKAQSFLNDLQKFAAATPFEFPELQTAASSLISAGINADKVIPIMRTLGDVTSGMGTGSEGVQRATVALQQMSAAGKISGEDLAQLRDAGIPVYDLLAKATGKSKDQVVALANAGKLGKKELDQMMSALESGKGLERFSGLMDKQSQSLTGLISTFKDTLGQGLATAVQPLIPLIKDGLGGASNALAKVLPKVATGLKEIVGRAKEVAGGIRAFGAAWKANDGDVTSSGFAGVMEKLANAGHKIFDELRPSLEKVGDAAKELWPSLKQIGTQLYEAYTSLGVSTWQLFKDALKALPGIIDTLAQNLSGLAKWMGENKTLVGAVVSALAVGVTVWKAWQVGVAIVTGYTKAYAAAQLFLNGVLTANPIGIVVVAIAALVAGLIYAYNTSETFRSYVSTAFSVVKIGAMYLAKVVVTYFQFIANIWMTVVGTILNGAAKAFGWIPGIGPKLQGAADAFGRFKDSANAKLNAIQDDITVHINTEQANIALEALHREFISKGWTVTAQVNANMTYAGGGKLVPAHASGGPVGPGLHVVGDNPDGSWNSTTELLAINGNGRVYNQKQIQLGGSASSGGGVMRLHPHDIAAIVDGMSQARPVATISQSAINRDLGRRSW